MPFRVGREHLARGQPLDAVEEGLGAVLVRPEAQVAVDRALVDLLLVEPAREDGLDLAGEQQHLALTARRGHPGHVQRLDAEVVAGQGEPLLLAVPDRQAEHPVEPVERLGAPLRERLEHHLGVGVGGELAPEGDELLAQVEVVVDLAVVGDRVAPVGGVHRLLAVRDVDDRQPAVRQPARAAGDDPLAVRPPVLLAVVHPLQQRVVGVESVVAGDAAHAFSGSSCSGRSRPASVGCRGPSLPRMPGQADFVLPAWSAPGGGGVRRAGGRPARR